jgi:hypothetical protein
MHQESSALQQVHPDRDCSVQYQLSRIARDEWTRCLGTDCIGTVRTEETGARNRARQPRIIYERRGEIGRKTLIRKICVPWSLNRIQHKQQTTLRISKRLSVSRIHDPGREAILRAQEYQYVVNILLLIYCVNFATLLRCDATCFELFFSAKDTNALL